MTGYPWAQGDALLADDLNAAIANSAAYGPFLPTTGGSLFGTITQAYTAPMSGAAYPPGPVGLNQQIILTGTVSDGFSGPEGHSMPFNLLYVNDQLNYTWNSAGSKIGQEIQWRTTAGGGSANAQYITMTFAPSAGYVGAAGKLFGGAGVLVNVNGNVTGGTAGGSSNPDFYGSGIELRQNAGPGNIPTYTSMLVGLEVDVASSAPVGSSANWIWGIKIGLGGSAAIAPVYQGAFLSFNGSGNGDTKIPYGILFDNLQSNSPPIAATGTAIFTHAATMAAFIDASAATFTSAFIKGPNGFAVDNANTVHTDALFAVTGSDINLLGNGGRLSLLARAGGTAVNYLSITSGNAGSGPVIGTASQGADANLDIGIQPQGTGQLNIAGTAATTATTPASFSANRRVQIKINGTSYWLPLATVAW